MSETVFITGNPNKAAFLEKWLEIDLAHQKIELEEIQSLELAEIVQHKARQAFDEVQKPVLVEDVGLRIAAMGRLPGPFIKWFIEEMTLQEICNLIPEGQDRTATSMVTYAWFNGSEMKLFEGSLDGSIVESPRGDRGFGFDAIFMPNGSDKTHAQMYGDEILQFGLRTTTVFPMLRNFFSQIDK